MSLNSFFINGKEIFPPLILAPMAGLSEKILRKTLLKMDFIGFAITELVPAEGVVRGTLRIEKYIDKEELNFTALQLCGGNVENLYEAAKIAVDSGVKFIDINMGCPVNKIIKGGGGAALLKDPQKAGLIVEKISKNLGVTVTCKIRSGFDENNLNFSEIGKILEDSGASAITIHARTRNQMYKGRSDWNHIACLKSLLKIPVIGNGDILTAEDAKRMFLFTKCDGVMIGRGAIKNPFIFKQIINLFENGRYDSSSFSERMDFLVFHFRNLTKELPDRNALHFMKVFVGKYTKGMEGSTKLRHFLSSAKNSQELLSAVEDFRKESKK